MTVPGPAPIRESQPADGQARHGQVSGPPRPGRSTFRRVSRLASRYLLHPPLPLRWRIGLLYTAVLGLTLDQASKYAVFSQLDNGQRENTVSIIPGAFELLTRYTAERETDQGFVPLLRSLNGEKLPQVNNGALFGWGNTWSWDANTFFALVSVAAALAIGRAIGSEAGGYVIVGAAIALAGIIAVVMARSRLARQPLAPTQTILEIRRDVSWMRHGRRPVD